MEKAFAERVREKIDSAFGRRVRLLRIETLAGDASSRRYHRAHLSGPGAPRSLMVMELAGSPLPLSSEELSIFREPPKELPFLNLHRFLSKVGVRVPALYGQWVKEGFLFLEDAGNLSLWDFVRDRPQHEVIYWYEKAMDQLLHLQVHGTQARNESCIAFQQRFDHRLYMWEFDHFMEYGVEKGRKGRIKAGERDQLTRTFSWISSRLTSQPPYLCHRDYHSWNLMVHEGELVVIDFQDALLAPVQYDLASLLNDRDTDSIILPELEKHFLNYYLERWTETGEARPAGEEFMEIYILSALQRDFKVVGRFEYLDLVKGKPAYRRFLPPTLKRIGRNLKRLPETEKLRSVLAPYFEEMR